MIWMLFLITDLLPLINTLTLERACFLIFTKALFYLPLDMAPKTVHLAKNNSEYQGNSHLMAIQINHVKIM